jgi:hypothetical protein
MQFGPAAAHRCGDIEALSADLTRRAGRPLRPCCVSVVWLHASRKPHRLALNCCTRHHPCLEPGAQHMHRRVASGAGTARLRHTAHACEAQISSPVTGLASGCTRVARDLGHTPPCAVPARADLTGLHGAFAPSPASPVPSHAAREHSLNGRWRPQTSTLALPRVPPYRVDPMTRFEPWTAMAPGRQRGRIPPCCRLLPPLLGCALDATCGLPSRSSQNVVLGWGDSAGMATRVAW